MFRVCTAILLLAVSVSAETLDTALARILRGRTGTAVVVEVESGKILGSYRLYLAAHRLARPGSAFKPFTLLALLESGKLKSSEVFTCRRTLHVGRHNLTCTHPPSGPLQAESALAYSCNDFFATIGKRLTAAELQAAFRQSGFTSPTGLAKSEAVGLIRPARTEEERQLQAIGEGEMRVTPLELLTAYRKLALRSLDGQMSDAERTVIGGLESSTNYGMARLASVKGFNIAGKTGTARSDRGSWPNAWFAGFAPADKPQIAIVVFLERGTGPGDAAPLASEIIQAWHKHNLQNR